MAQALLADRFTLAFHREPRDLRVYAIVVGDRGPRLTLFTAVQEQLGLKLESTTAPVDALVDGVERPSEN